jgi:hypothetical protein
MQPTTNLSPKLSPRSSRPTLTTPRLKQYPALKVLLKSTGLSAAIIITIVTLLSGFGQIALPFHHGDDLSESQIKARLTAFNALPPVKLMLISDDQIMPAVKDMGLSAKDEKALLADLTRKHTSHIDASAATEETSALSKPIAQSVAVEQKATRLRLAWISLWDTDVEDGDTVQIDSEGFSKTIVLKKTPVTLAVPVPEAGILHVRGIRDGDGGGITVGLASGQSVAVFPIMSEDQVLGLSVTR